MPQIQPSGRGLLPSPSVWSPDQQPAAMLADVSRYVLGRTEGRGLGFGQLVRTHTGKCLKCQPSSDGLSNHSALCASGRERSAGPAPVSRQEIAPKQQEHLCSEGVTGLKVNHTEKCGDKEDSAHSAGFGSSTWIHASFST